MAGGLGNKIELNRGYSGGILEGYLSKIFVAPPMTLAQVAGICNDHGYSVRTYRISNVADVESDTNRAIILGTS